MELTTDKINDSTKPKSKRFLTLDIGRGLAILGMLVLHIISDTLDIDNLLSDFSAIPLINILLLVILPFFGGLAGFFLLISAIGNMISTYRNLKRGKSVRSIVFKQVFGGIILLIFAMLIESILGYHGVVGNFFLNLDNPSETNWRVMLYAFNTFETIHTIAWCLIINGLVQGLMSLKGNWKNTRDLIIAYIALIVMVIAVTQPIWDLVNYLIPGYPFTTDQFGHDIARPRIGWNSFWELLRAPFLTSLAAPVEPIFPYLAVSFIGSIIGITLSQPKEKISEKFPRRLFLGGLIPFIAGTIGVIIIIVNILNTKGFDEAIDIYRLISYHRHWDPDYKTFIPMFSWLAQFSSLNGFSIMIVAFLLRMLEFRGKSSFIAKRTKFVRRFGTIACTNYTMQWIYQIMFLLVSLMIYQNPYQRLFWPGTILTLIFSLGFYGLMLFAWEKVNYIGSVEWMIRTLAANIVPIRRDLVSDKKWWQRGQINVQRNFYNVEWIDLSDSTIVSEKLSEKSTTESAPQTEEISRKEGSNGLSRLQETNDSNFALILSIVGFSSILFIVVSIFALVITIRARKTEGKNTVNTTALVLSIVGIVMLAGLIITTLILPASTVPL